MSGAAASLPPAARRSRLRVAALFPILAAAFISLFAAELAIGTVRIPLAEIATILSGGEPSQPIWRVIVLELRLPRVITACLAGAALALGGLTPSLGLLRAAKRLCPSLPALVLLRPREGNFVYSQLEAETILADLAALRDAGADGFVFGALTDEGLLDETLCQRVIR
ncbi:MAG: copper homeostasis protein CutC, partial [Acidobacteriota bacterium]